VCANEIPKIKKDPNQRSHMKESSEKAGKWDSSDSSGEKVEKRGRRQPPCRRKHHASYDALTLTNSLAIE